MRKKPKLYNYNTVLLNKRRITSFIDISSLFFQGWTQSAFKEKAAILDHAVYIVFYSSMQADAIWKIS